MGVYVYYETIEGDAGLAELDEDGLHEQTSGEYGTTYEMAHDSFYEFMQGADKQMFTIDDLSEDEDGFYYPDGFIRFKVLRGEELSREEFHDL